jgi:hypothetical protein
VFLDDGTVAGFGPDAFARSGLRLLRQGQRVAISRAPDGTVVSLTLATFPLDTDGMQDTGEVQGTRDARPG